MPLAAGNIASYHKGFPVAEPSQGGRLPSSYPCPHRATSTVFLSTGVCGSSSSPVVQPPSMPLPEVLLAPLVITHGYYRACSCKPKFRITIDKAADFIASLPFQSWFSCWKNN